MNRITTTKRMGKIYRNGALRGFCISSARSGKHLPGHAENRRNVNNINSDAAGSIESKTNDDVHTKSAELSSLLLDLSKSSTILHSAPAAHGYSRPASSVVSKEPNDIFDDRKLFFGIFESAATREVKTIDLNKKVSEAIKSETTDRAAPLQSTALNNLSTATSVSPSSYTNKIHRVDKIEAFTSNDRVINSQRHASSDKPHQTNKKKVYPKKLNQETNQGDVSVDLDSVLSFLNKNVR